MYAMIGTRPDIACAVLAVSPHSTNPGATNRTAVHRVFSYLAATRAQGLLYRSGYCRGGTNTDWRAGEDRRSIGGYALLVN